MIWLGLDIGGANLKLASSRGYAKSLAFPLWKKPHELELSLRQLLREAPRADGLAITMTGELADCFETKKEGVLHILGAVERAANSMQVAVYQINGRFVSIHQARQAPLLAAATNWHALARYVLRLIPDFPAILLDIGSTTTDVIPLLADGIGTASLTDTDRLVNGELVYLGITRTPIATIISSFLYRGQECPVASELFATTADAAVWLGHLSEQSTDCDTADGRPFTKPYSRDRLARMICADRETFTENDALEAARCVWNCQTKTIDHSLRTLAKRLPSSPRIIVVSGSGEPLAEAAVNSSRLCSRIVRFSARHGSETSQVAPAYAVAVLASEQGIDS